jgi:hypothetical protein
LLEQHIEENQDQPVVGKHGKHGRPLGWSDTGGVGNGAARASWRIGIADEGTRRGIKAPQ